jgi:hypothetical protein
MAKQMTPSEEEELHELFPGEKQGHVPATTLMATPSSMAKTKKQEEDLDLLAN